MATDSEGFPLYGHHIPYELTAEYLRGNHTEALNDLRRLITNWPQPLTETLMIGLIGRYADALTTIHGEPTRAAIWAETRALEEEVEADATIGYTDDLG